MSKPEHCQFNADKVESDLGHGKGIPISTPDLLVLQEIRVLLKKQNDLLSSIEKHQVNPDLSMQPVTPLPARSGSVWNSLLKSTVKNAEPTLDRWRGGLDTLLIFIALFSAIITAFLVESLKTIQPSDVARTNELLANLTDIIVVFGTRNSSARDVEFRNPDIFVPKPSDVRINIYWSIALVISLSLAALSVAGRGYLSFLMKAEGDAVSRLTEIHERWVIAKSLLGPYLEGLPQVLLVPVALFIAGLIDSLFSLSSDVHLIYTTSYISALFAIMTAIVLLGALLHGIHYPKTSPFQTSLSSFLNSRELEKAEDPEKHPERDMSLQRDFEESSLSSPNLKAYHMAVQEAFDDETLEQASAVLEEVITDSGQHEQFRGQIEYPDQTFRTILHLLSPEASFRCNLTAAKMIRRAFLGPSFKDQDLHLHDTFSDVLSSHQRATLLMALRRTAEEHLEHRPFMLDGTPTMILMAAMASLIPIQGRADYSHPIPALLSANYLTRQPNHSLPHELVETYNRTMWFIISVLFRLLVHHFGDNSLTDRVKFESAFVSVFGPCTLQPMCGKQLLLSLMNNPPTAQNTSYQDSVNYEMATDCFVSWVAVGEHALQTTMAVVDTVLLEYINPDPADYQPTHRSYHRVVHYLMLLVYRATEASSPQSLSFCSKFILKVSETFVWDVGRFMSLRIILRFLILLNENIQTIDIRSFETARQALMYVYQWTLYRAATFGDYDILLPGFQDTLPPRDLLLSLIHKEWLKFSYAESGSYAVKIPGPLPGWGLDPGD